MVIKLSLFKPKILESVKNETFLRGQIDKAADEKAITVAYHEQAGDDLYQERILDRGFYTYLAELKTFLTDYVSNSGYTTADNITDTEQDGVVTLMLEVGDRFNQAYTDPLAKLSSKYIEEGMLVDWWKPVNEKQAALYLQFQERDLAAIKRCFNKTAPAAPTVPYTTQLTTTGSAIELEVGEEHTVTYTISDGAIDDIECRVADTVLIVLGRTHEGFTVRALQRGHTTIELYSRHNTALTRQLHVYITDHT